MSYNINAGDTVYLGKVKLKVLKAPQMSRYFEERGQILGWVKCEVIEDETGQYKPGYISEFNGDFLRK